MGGRCARCQSELHTSIAQGRCNHHHDSQYQAQRVQQKTQPKHLCKRAKKSPLTRSQLETTEVHLCHSSGLKDCQQSHLQPAGWRPFRFQHSPPHTKSNFHNQKWVPQGRECPQLLLALEKPSAPSVCPPQSPQPWHWHMQTFTQPRGTKGLGNLQVTHLSIALRSTSPHGGGQVLWEGLLLRNACRSSSWRLTGGEGSPALTRPWWSPTAACTHEGAPQQPTPPAARP